MFVFELNNYRILQTKMISILMPIKNGIEFINESVSSIRNQTDSCWELIIGINGCGENSEVFKRAKEFEAVDKRIKVFDQPTHIKTKSDALNDLVQRCSPESDWISLLDVDDIWLPTKLESQRPYMDGTYDVIGTRCVYFGNSTGAPNIPVGNITKFNFLQVNPIINSSCLVRKHLCSWNPSYHIIEDYELWLRLWTLGHTFYNVASVQVRHRLHASSAFNTQDTTKAVQQLRINYSQPKK